MGQLKAGSINDMANSMADRIDKAMQAAWPTAFPGQSLPEQGRRDRQVLFVAIANGVLAISTTIWAHSRPTSSGMMRSTATSITSIST